MQPEEVVIADLIRERDEAREQVRALTDRVDQMEAAYRRLTEQLAERERMVTALLAGCTEGREQVRSLTVERDHLAMVVEQRKAAGASYREALEKIGTDANDLRGRLSRAREALADFDEEQPHYRDGKEAEDNWRARQESALVALRAALAEPLGGDA